MFTIFNIIVWHKKQTSLLEAHEVPFDCRGRFIRGRYYNCLFKAVQIDRVWRWIHKEGIRLIISPWKNIRDDKTWAIRQHRQNYLGNWAEWVQNQQPTHAQAKSIWGLRILHVKWDAVHRARCHLIYRIRYGSRNGSCQRKRHLRFLAGHGAEQYLNCKELES